MRGFAWALALAAAGILVGSGDAWARSGRCGGGRGGCGGGRGGCGGGCYGGGCGGGYCGGGSGGCYGGYCGGGTACSGGYCMTTPAASGGGTYASATEGPVTLIVSLPADAKLLIDGYQTASTSGERTFVSPALKKGKDYYYTLKAELVRNGQAQTVTQQVKVRAGEETRVTLDIPTNAVASR
jgi:uncharacterized protein (TIGR03000 family)